MVKILKLEEMLVKYNSTSSENIIKRIAFLHLTFEHIHPFVDGNGRIGRVINNYLLMRKFSDYIRKVNFSFEEMLNNLLSLKNKNVTILGKGNIGLKTLKHI